ADPGARRQHGLQRLPRARLDPRAGPLPAAPAAHPGRPAGRSPPHPPRQRQLHTRGDVLPFSTGILILAAFAVVLVLGFQAEVTRLIPLYTVGVFVSFTLS